MLKSNSRVVLIVGELDFVLDPNNGRRRVSLNVALEVHVILEGLAQTRPRHGDHWRKLHLHCNVSTGAFSNSILGYTVVGASVFLPDLSNFQDVAPAMFFYL